MGMIAQCVRRRVMTTVLVLIGVIVGALSYFELGLRRMPEIDLPFATISTVYPGGSPAEVETEITRPIEDAVSSISGIDELTSYSQQGLSLVMIQFELEEDIDDRADDIRSQIDRIRSLLPDEAEDPVVQKFDISRQPVVTLALSGPQGSNRLFRLAEEELATELSQVQGVANVEITGGQRREIHVLLRVHDLRRLRIPISAVVGALRAANVAVPAGHITQKGREVMIRTTGRFRSVEDIRDVQVPTRGRGRITVGDLGQIVDTYGEARSSARYSGRESVALVVTAESGANEVEVADGIYARMGRLRGMLPEGARLEIGVDETRFVRGALANVRNNMLIGILLTSLALYLFLRSGRATLVMVVVMPVSVVLTFALMRVSGFTLNILSLTGLAIVIGVLVNNAILIVENVTRFIHEGMDPVQAAEAGTKDIALAIFSSTATNLVVFIPLAFMGEIIGRFFLELGLTVAYATTVSLLVSYSLTPMMCGLLLRKHESRPGLLARCADGLFGWSSLLWQWAFARTREVYLDLLDWCLTHRLTTVAMTVVAFAASLGVFGVVGTEFAPPSDEGWLRVTVRMPVGSSLAATEEAMGQVEEVVSHMPRMARSYTRVGTVTGFLAGSSEGVNLAEMRVYVGDRAERDESLDDLMNWLRPRLAQITSAEVIVQTASHGPGGSPVAVEISGAGLEQLQAVASQVAQVVAEVPGTTGVTLSYQPGQPEMRIEPRFEDMDRHGVSVRDLAFEVRSYIEGSTASQFLDEDENYDIQVKLRDEDMARPEDVNRMYVNTPGTGEMVHVSEVADVVEAAGPMLITRKDRRRLITVTAALTGDRPSGTVVADVKKELAARVRLPGDVRIDYGGESEMKEKNFKELFKAMATAAVLTFLAVAGIIESFGTGVIIIMALPVCLIGVALALLIGGVTVNIFSLMAMVILVGMVVNNAIIVLDCAARRLTEGVTARQAVREACALRFRMIVMANLSTVVALIPLSLGLGFGGEMFRPLAVVQMGGVLAAAVLSLVVIPVLYVMAMGRRGRPEQAGEG